MASMSGRESTADGRYTDYLVGMQARWWKRLLRVQLPYRWHVRTLRLGKVLDLGCGIGRNLLHLEGGPLAVGVDTNDKSVAVARARGLVAFTPEEFRASPFARPAGFDALLLAHVAEHLGVASSAALVGEYREYVRTGGRVVVITPQEATYRADDTHVEFIDFEKSAAIVESAGLDVVRQYSFPFPRWMGRFFKHNEFVTIAVNR